MTQRPQNDAPIIALENLRVNFPHRVRPAVENVSLSVRAGECLALVGESGSGKSVTARALLGLAGEAADVTADRMELQGVGDLRRLGERDWQKVRGTRVGLVLQDALSSLDPLRSVIDEVSETLRLHDVVAPAERDDAAVALLESVGFPDPRTRGRMRSTQLSGGQRQRALIASAIAAFPELIIADEATTALDATVQRVILDLLRSLIDQHDRGLLLITHDLSVVARIADRVAVMQNGEIVEEGEALQLLEDPRHPYTRHLLAAVPRPERRGMRLSDSPAPGRVDAPPPESYRTPAVDGGVRQAVAVAGDGLTRTFRLGHGRSLTAISEVNIRVESGRTLGVVGESGSGKSTLGRIIAGQERLDSGTLRVGGADWSALRGRELRRHRRRVQVISQNPLASFDPRYTGSKLLHEAIGSATDRRVARSRVTEILEAVRLPSEVLSALPRELSGGQRQRLAIARALLAEPEVLVCDEAVSALDVSVQAQILDLLSDVQTQTGFAMVFISHDLNVVHHLSDDVLVMNKGRVVESGPVESVYRDPSDAYTRTLLASAQP